MSPPIKIIMTVATLAIGAWLVFGLANEHYLKPRAELIARIDSAQVSVSRDSSEIAKHGDVLEGIQEFVERTLGGDLETVDHKLRTRLSRIAEQVELQNAVASTVGSPKDRRLPDAAKTRFPGRGNRELYDEIDFVEVEGSVTGSGTLDQVLRLVEAIEAEPWLKNIERLQLDPRATDNGERITVTLRLTTIFLPNRSSNDRTTFTAADSIAENPAARELAAINPFRVPPPQAVASTGPKPGRQAPPGFDYAQWRLTGIAETATGVEFWLLNSSTKETRRLTVGEKLHEITIVGTRGGDAAEFSHASADGLQRFLVAVGGKLSDRTPVVPVDLSSSQ